MGPWTGADNRHTGQHQVAAMDSSDRVEQTSCRPGVPPVRATDTGTGARLLASCPAAPARPSTALVVCQREIDGSTQPGARLDRAASIHRNELDRLLALVTWAFEACGPGSRAWGERTDDPNW